MLYQRCEFQGTPGPERLVFLSFREQVADSEVLLSEVGGMCEEAPGSAVFLSSVVLSLSNTVTLYYGSSCCGDPQSQILFVAIS